MNPGSMAKVRVNPMSERFFLCFHAMHIGFLKGCRPLIGLDGCHLSSEFVVIFSSETSAVSSSGYLVVGFEY
ncbi:hypothetical protein Dsin_012722 [Dipteronia sinensis]|uniref:Uncharacterized protein n=1 Tax=Dipteronia sinensis TaxID=43782 RepID=A0AAE0E8R0_9ROSI|nr:hypothetical protein Dsin_012722 [Dipteronia sinensis]